jgi:hypothetical protein
LFSYLEKAIGKAVSESRFPDTLFTKLQDRKSDLIRQPLLHVAEALTEFEDSIENIRKLTKATETSKPPPGPFSTCSLCNKPGHSQDRCRAGRQKKCRHCNKQVTDFRAHNKTCRKKTPTVPTSMVETVDVGRTGVTIKGQTFIPALTSCHAQTPKGKVPLVGYVDTGPKTL